MYSKQRFLSNNLITSATMLTPSSQATGRISGVSTTAAGSATWTASGSFAGSRDLLVTIQIDSVAGGASVGQATFSWKTSETTSGWEATGVTTSTSPISLGMDGKKIAWTAGDGDDFVQGDIGIFWCYAPFGAGKVIDLDRDTYWQGTGVASTEGIAVAFGSALNITACIVADHNLTSNATAYLQANTTNSWGSPAYSAALTIQDPMVLYLNQTYRYWRVAITDTTNSDGYIQIGELYLGTYTELVSNYARPLWGSEVNRKRNTVENRSETGRRAQRLWSIQREFELKYDTLDQTDVTTLQTIWEGLQDVDTGIVNPIWIHYFQDEASTLMLCHILSGFNMRYRSYGLFSTSIQCEEVAKTRL